MSIVQKLRLITLSNFHSLLDKIIDMNKIGEVEQYIRDLQEGRDGIDDERAIQESRVNSIPADIAVLQAQWDEANQSIDIFLNDTDPTNDHFVEPLEAELMSLEGQIGFKNEELKNAQAKLAQYVDVVRKLDVRLNTMRGRLTVLKQIDQTTQGEERAKKIFSGINLSDVPDTTGVEQEMREKAAVATNALNRELGRVTGAVANVKEDAALALRIAKRRQALKGTTETQS